MALERSGCPAIIDLRLVILHPIRIAPTCSPNTGVVLIRRDQHNESKVGQEASKTLKECSQNISLRPHRSFGSQHHSSSDCFFVSDENMIITPSRSFANLQRLFHTFFTSLAGKVLLISLLLYGLAFEYCSVRYWRDPHSAFFDDTHVYDLKYSLYREHEALQHISAYNARIQPPASTFASSSPQMCLALVTVKRDHVNYFDASVGSLLSGLDDRERRAFSVNVLFANTNPDLHPSWGQLWMDRLVDSALSYNVSQEDFQRLQALEESHNYYEKGV